MSWQNVAICESCWIEQNAKYDDHDVLVSIRQPIRLKEVSIEVCYNCRMPTIFGAYVRVDMSTHGK